MNNILPKIITKIIVLVFMGLVLPVTHAFAAPSILLSPTTVSVAQNAEFTLTVTINSDATQVMGSDVTINYAGEDLDVVSVTTGSYFPVFTYANTTSGILELHSYTLSTLENHSGSGTLATIKFKAKKGSGSSSVTILCTGNGHDTNIRSTTGANLLASCTQINQAGITYTGTNTPTPTSPSGSTPTPTTVTGNNTIPTCASLHSDITESVGSPLAVTFTCSGVDPDGYINAVEFIFGDGTSDIVEKNAGSPGSISTTHTYTTIGTLGASCRVRDNNTVWSSTPQNCKKIITIRPKPTSAPRARPTLQDFEYALTPTPTPIEIAMITDTPEPTREVTPAPTLYPEEDTSDTTGSSRRLWWILGGIIAVVLAFLLLRRRNPPGNPPQPIPQYPPPPVG